MGRFLPAGQVQGNTLQAVLTSEPWRQVAASIPGGHHDPCSPDCGPNDDTCKGGGTCDPASGFSPTIAD
ncbi:hypothetical protein [Streptomyces noursei]|uniref:hypothetical protein n=1 Tax=Streptomyces noursei TaxID=1971 RepID=UPI0027E2F9FF|nr:hypothetical protein [Streptomyces noursei]